MGLYFFGKSHSLPILSPNFTMYLNTGLQYKLNKKFIFFGCFDLTNAKAVYKEKEYYLYSVGLGIKYLTDSCCFLF